MAEQVARAPSPLLSEQQRRCYAEHGYAVIDAFLDVAQVTAIQELLISLVRDAVRQSGQVGWDQEIYGRSVPPERRLPYVQYERGVARPQADDPRLLDRVRKVANFQRHEPIATLIRGGEVERVLSEITGPDPVMLHCLAQLKPPFVGTAKGWHQDNAYFSVAPLDAVLALWIALHDTDTENGCLHLALAARGWGPLRHVHDGECSIPFRAIADAQIKPVPMRAGDAILFHGLLPHASPPNRSDRRRWALTFHYRRRDSRVVANEEFETLFVDREGVPAGCAAAARRVSPDVAGQWRD